LQAVAQQPDGIGSPEKVDIASAEASTLQYIGLLTVAVAAGLLFAYWAIADGAVHCLPAMGTVIAGCCTYTGASYLGLQRYVDTVQRPESRVSVEVYSTRTQSVEQ
jgi:hypothetical protein